MHSPDKAAYFYDLIVSLVPIMRENVVHSVSQVLTMVWLVAAGRGLAFVPEAATRLGVEGVAYLPFARQAGKPVELHLLWLKEAKNTALWQVLDRLDGLTL
ncbi:LysR substrate-binding domain-containing protein [Actinomadura madurae]|nr:LysR substrate-binding domain-containing protein [Actinomadura madurae]